MKNKKEKKKICPGSSVGKKVKMKKKCIICGKEFETMPKGYARKYCFQCSPSYSKNNNNERAKSITAIRHAIKQQLVRYKGGKCELCGYDKCLGALQFHHLDPNKKDFNPSKEYNRGAPDMDKLKQEIDKCQLLCANCHSEVHFNRGDSL